MRGEGRWGLSGSSRGPACTNFGGTRKARSDSNPIPPHLMATRWALAAGARAATGRAAVQARAEAISDALWRPLRCTKVQQCAAGSTSGSSGSLAHHPAGHSTTAWSLGASPWAPESLSQAHSAFGRRGRRPGIPRQVRWQTGWRSGGAPPRQAINWFRQAGSICQSCSRRTQASPLPCWPMQASELLTR